MIMKKKAFLFATALLTASVIFYACKKNNEGTTNLRVNLTDAPFDASMVNVDIKEVNVKFRDDSTSWIKLSTKAGVYNLLGLQNGVDTLLAVGPVPTGLLKEIRLVLGTENSIVINDTIYPLTIPSGGTSGLKIKVNKNLAAGIDSILVDFDAGLSVIKTGNGTYSLKPVIKLK